MVSMPPQALEPLSMIMAGSARRYPEITLMVAAFEYDQVTHAFRTGANKIGSAPRPRSIGPTSG